MSGPIIYGIVSGGCQFLAFATYIAFFFVAMTALRSRRPDAWFPFGAAAGLFVFAAILHITSSFAMKVSAFSYKLDTYYAFMSGMTVVTTALSIIGWILIMIGLVKIASPPSC